MMQFDVALTQSHVQLQILFFHMRLGPFEGRIVTQFHAQFCNSQYRGDSIRRPHDPQSHDVIWHI